MASRKHDGPNHSPLKLLLWATLVAFLFGFTNLYSLPEDLLRTSRNKLHMQQASGDIVLIAIDDASLRQVGRWPWPRKVFADIITKADEAGAKRIFFDVIVNTKSEDADDRYFAEALKKAGNVTLPMQSREGPGDGTVRNIPPLAMFAKHAEVASVALAYNYQNAVWRIPYAARTDDGVIPSFSAKLAGVSVKPGGLYAPDYSIDPKSIPTIASTKLLDPGFDARLLRGKDVVIGATAESLNDTFFLTGTGKMGGAYVHIIGAESLKEGTAHSLGWLPALAIALMVATLALFSRQSIVQNWLLAAARW